MLEKLQIAFTVVSALFLAALLPVWAIFTWKGASVCGVGAGIFFTAMLIVKRANRKNLPSEPTVNDETSQAEEKTDEKP